MSITGVIQEYYSAPKLQTYTIDTRNWQWVQGIVNLDEEDPEPVFNEYGEYAP